MNFPKFPHSAMFLGATNFGKTEYLIRILETEYKNHFEFIVIMCPTISDNNKTYLSRKWIFDDNNVFIVCDVEEKLNEWIKLFRNTSKFRQTLFIIDDCYAEGEINKKRDALSELAFSGRHRNYSLWVLTQKYNSISKDVREQLNPIWTGGGGRNPPPLRFFLHNSKTPGDIEKKLSDFNFTPLMDILSILSIAIVVRCCHSNLLFLVCHVIFWVEKTKKLELFSR